MVVTGDLSDSARKQAILAGTPYVVTKQFPWKLHEMLDVVEENGDSSIVSWLPDGIAFKVHKPDSFVEKIMKRFFNQTKYKSFQRQLNLWGFERNSKKCLEKGAYYHPLFRRGRRDLCQEMGRQKIKCPKDKKMMKSGIAPSAEGSAAQLIQTLPSPTQSSQLPALPAGAAELLRQQQLYQTNDMLQLLHGLEKTRSSPATSQLLPLLSAPSASAVLSQQLDAEILRSINARLALENMLVTSLARSWDPVRGSLY